jgi:hypothetical protein
MAEWRKGVLAVGVAALLAGFGLRIWALPGLEALTWVLIGGGGIAALAGLLLLADALRRRGRDRPLRQGARAAIDLLIVLAILVLMNFVAMRHPYRRDLTAGEVHTLSPQTVTVLKSLDLPVDGTAFFLPEHAPQRRRLEELAVEYRYHAPEFHIDIVDAQARPEIAQAWDVSVVPTVVLRGGERRARFTTISERELTNALVRVTRNRETVVYFLTGHGERKPDDTGADGYREAADRLRQQRFAVRTLNLADGARVPGDADVIVVAGPSSPLLSREVELLEGWLTAGGGLLLMADPGTTSGLEDLVDRSGVRIGKRFVLDAGLAARLVDGGFAPVATEYAFHPVTEGFDLNTVWPSTVAVETDPDVAVGTDAVVLVRSTAGAWEESDSEAIRAGAAVRFDAGRDLPGPLGLAAAVSRAAGPEAGERHRDEAPLGEGDPATAAHGMRLVIFGTSLLAANRSFYRVGNADLFLNAVSWLAGEADLLAIRPRAPGHTPLVLTAAEARWYLWTLVVGVPTLVAVLGLGLWWRRRGL